MRIDPRAAIITGASSGIGAALARQLAAAGVAVGLTARRGELLKDLAGEIEARGGTVAVAVADATDRGATRAAVERLGDWLGPIDLLIANAGVVHRTPGAGFSSEVFEEMVRTNLLGPAHAIEAVLPGMVERGRGQIVGISSVAGYRGLPRTAGYCATKAGLSVLLEGLRVDLRSRGILVTTVHPGYVRTAMTAGADHARPWMVEPDRAARIILRGISAGRAEINFPWPMATLMSAIRRLPVALYDPLADRLRPDRGDPQ